MRDGSEMIFGVDTSQAVESLKKLDKALKDTLYRMGNGSVAPFSTLAQSSSRASQSVEAIAKELNKLEKEADKSSKGMVSYSQKVGDASYRLRVGLTADYASVQKQLETFHKELNNPQSFLFHQKKMQEDMLATKKWANERKLTLDNLLSAETTARRKNLNDLRRDIEARSTLSVAHHQSEVKNFTDHIKRLTQNESQGRRKQLAEMKKIYLEREAETRRHAKEMERIERNVASQRARQTRLAMAYDESTLQSRLNTLAKIQALHKAGYSTSMIARRHGVEAIGDLRNIESLQKQLAQQKEMERIERAAISTRKQGVTSVNNSTGAIAKNNQALHDARGLARGLSGSLGQLWMTYGAITPLLTGAALGSIARQTYTVGKDIEYRLKMLEALGNRPVTAAEMMPAVHGSMKTPLEAAQGLQELAQAGLNANESLAVLNTTLQLATLGEMSVAEAALTTTAALSTFHLEVYEAARVGDVFAKTASVSNTTVKGIADAMRQAGSAASIYGVSIEETSAQIAILAQNGIRGSAAGTAIRNAMTEIHAPTKKARELMEKFNIQMYEDGRARNYISVLEDLRGVYYSLDDAGQNALLKGMFNERSRRAIQIYMQDLVNLKKTIGEVSDSQFFLLDANLKLLATVEGSANRMQSILQQTLVEAFEDLKPNVITTIRALESLFESEGFKTGVKTLGGTIANLTSLLADHSGTITTVIGYYVALRVATMAAVGVITSLQRAKGALTAQTVQTSTAIASETAAITTNTEATTANSAAKATLATRTTTLLTTLVRMTNVVGAVSIAVMGVVSAYRAYQSATNSLESSQNSAIPTLDDMTKSIRLQNAELERNIRLQREKALGLPEGSLGLVDTRASAQERADNLTTQRSAKYLEVLAKEELVKTWGKEGSLSENYAYTQSRALAEYSQAKKELSELDSELSKVHNSLKDSERAWAQNVKLSETSTKLSIQNRADDLYKQVKMIETYGKISPDNQKLRDALAEAHEVNRQFRENEITDVEVYEYKMGEALNNVRKHQDTLKIDEGKPDRRMERAIERFDEWYKKQLLAIKTNKEMAQAYLDGEDSLREYNLQQQIGEQIIKDKTKSYEKIRSVLVELYKTQDYLKVAEETAKLTKQVKVADSYVKVLEAQSKGWEEGKKALNEFNREQALNELLTHTSAKNLGELTEVIERFNKAFIKDQAAKQRNEDLETLNQLVESTKNNQTKYNDELRKLERLKGVKGTAEQMNALDQAIKNLHVSNDGYLKILDQGFNDLDNSMSNMWTNFLEDGTFSMESISKTFKKTLAEMAHESLTRPIIITLQNAVLGTNHSGGFGQGGSGALDLLGLGKNLQSGWSALSGGLTSSLSKGIGFVGQKLGSSALTSFASGLAGIGSTSAAGVTAVAPSALASLGTTVGTQGLSSAAYGASMSGFGAGSAVAAAAPWVAGAFAAYQAISMISKMTKGETRFGGGFTQNLDTGRASYHSGPSGGASGMESAVSSVFGRATNSITSLFDALGVSANLVQYHGAYESSGKGRGGTFSGGTINIDGKDIYFGTSKKGEGFGGRSGSPEEMFENLQKDTAFTVIEAWQAAADVLPQKINEMIQGINVRELSPEGVEELIVQIETMVAGVKVFSDALTQLPFEHLTQSSTDAKLALISLFESVDESVQGLNYFYQNFYTEQEKTANLTRVLTDEFARLGQTLPASIEAYRSLFDAQDVSTEEGRNLTAMLLKLAPSFVELKGGAGSLTDSLAENAKKLYDAAKSTTDNVLNELRRLGQEEINRLKQTTNETDKAFANYERLNNKLVEGFRSIMDAVTDAVDGLRRVAPARDGSYQTAISQINDAVRTGNVSNVDQILKAIDIVSQGAVSGTFGSKYEADRERLLAASRIAELNKIVEPQLTEAEKALETAKKQLDVLRGTYEETEDINLALSKFWTAVEQEQFANQQIKAIEAQLEWAEKQYNELRDLNDKFTDFGQALQAFIEAVSVESSAKGATGSGSSHDGFSREHQYLLNNPDVAKHFRDSAHKEMTAEKFARYHYTTYGQSEGRTFAKGGYYPGGLALVGEEGPELINFSNPGQVYTNNQTLDMLRPDSDIYKEFFSLHAKIYGKTKDGSDTLEFIERILQEQPTQEALFSKVDSSLENMFANTSSMLTTLTASMMHSINSAVTEMASAVSSAVKSSSSSGSKDYTDYFNANPDVAKAYRDGAGGGMSASEYASYHYAVYGQFEGRKFARGGFYSGGLALVGEEGPELINFNNPGQVYTNEQTRAILQQGTNQEAMAAMVFELQQLRQEVSELRREQRQASFQVVKTNMKVANNTEDLVRLSKSDGNVTGTVVTYP